VIWRLHVCGGFGETAIHTVSITTTTTGCYQRLATMLGSAPAGATDAEGGSRKINPYANRRNEPISAPFGRRTHRPSKNGSSLRQGTSAIHSEGSPKISMRCQRRRWRRARVRRTPRSPRELRTTRAGFAFDGRLLDPHWASGDRESGIGATRRIKRAPPDDPHDFRRKIGCA